MASWRRGTAFHVSCAGLQAVARRVRKEEATLAAMRDRGETIRVRVHSGFTLAPLRNHRAVDRLERLATA